MKERQADNVYYEEAVNDPTRTNAGLAPVVDAVSLSSLSAGALRQSYDRQKRWSRHDTSRHFLNLLLCRSLLKRPLG